MYFVCGQSYLPGQLLYITMRFGDKVEGIDNSSLMLRFRVQRLEKIQRSGAQQFGVAVALDI
jgi:hypothetical protein